MVRRRFSSTSSDCFPRWHSQAAIFFLSSGQSRELSYDRGLQNVEIRVVCVWRGGLVQRATKAGSTPGSDLTPLWMCLERSIVLQCSLVADVGFDGAVYVQINHRGIMVLNILGLRGSRRARARACAALCYMCL